MPRPRSSASGAAPLKRPTHFSQFVPLGVSLWGRRFLESGCISAHYRNAVFEGEEVSRLDEPPAGGQQSHRDLDAGKRTAPKSCAALCRLRPTPRRPHSTKGSPGSHRPGRWSSCATFASACDRSASGWMDFDQVMGALYPFSLAQKLTKITQASSWYSPASGASSPWGHAIIPMEMISVLLNYTAKLDPFPVRGPVVGLFVRIESG